MVGSLSGRRWPPDVNEFVEAYESAQDRDGRADLTDFAPPPGHPERLPILCELVRVDLEYHWRRSQSRRLEYYRDLFPDLFEGPEFVRAMAYEEYRLRAQAGERPTQADYQRRFGIEDGRWPPSPLSGPCRRGREDSSSGLLSFVRSTTFELACTSAPRASSSLTTSTRL